MSGLFTAIAAESVGQAKSCVVVCPHSMVMLFSVKSVITVVRQGSVTVTANVCYGDHAC